MIFYKIYLMSEKNFYKSENRKKSKKIFKDLD